MGVTAGVFGFVMLSVMFSVSAQLLLKLGTRCGPILVSYSGRDVVNYLLYTVGQPFFISGVFLYLFSLFTWVLCLARLPLSTAYPMLSLGYVVNALLAYCVLHERLSVVQWIGLCIIILGVFLVASYPPQVR